MAIPKITIWILLLSLSACCLFQHKTERDPAQRAAFMRANPCPVNGNTRGPCPGYVVDHIQALKRGGADHPNNMQWQTTEAAKFKDRWE